MTRQSPLIELAGISLVREGRTILSDVDLSVYRGDFLAVTGPNGGGKTSLLRILLKLLPPTRGTVSYASSKLSISYLPQKNAIDSRFPITVDEVIESGLIAKKISKEEKRRLTDATIDLVGLEAHRDKSIGTLSGGQLQRALMGRAIISEPEVLVLDEPLSYVDKQFEQRIYNIIEELQERTTIILVSHEMSTIAGMASRHIVVDHTVSECHAAHHHVHYDCDCLS